MMSALCIHCLSAEQSFGWQVLQETIPEERGVEVSELAIHPKL